MANTPFKLKSGNSPLYKSLGSSPAKFTTAIGRWLKGYKKEVSDRGTEYIYDKDTREIVKEKVDGKWTKQPYFSGFGGGKNIGLHYLDVDRYAKQEEESGITKFLQNANIIEGSPDGGRHVITPEGNVPLERKSKKGKK